MYVGFGVPVLYFFCSTGKAQIMQKITFLQFYSWQQLVRWENCLGKTQLQNFCSTFASSRLLTAHKAYRKDVAYRTERPPKNGSIRIHVTYRYTLYNCYATTFSVVVAHNKLEVQGCPHRVYVYTSDDMQTLTYSRMRKVSFRLYTVIRVLYW